jgi:hypothetical protein
MSRLNERDFLEIHEAVIAAGVPEPVATEVVQDFLSETYWNDPKNAGRRIRAEGGHSVTFFDYLSHLDWGI